MQDVAVARPRRGQALIRQLHPLTQGVVLLEHLRRWRYRARISSLNHQTLQIDVRGQVIEVGTHRMG
ncbi:hypothetical protein D3C80_1832570 [compost metagenome]